MTQSETEEYDVTDLDLVSPKHNWFGIFDTSYFICQLVLPCQNQWFTLLG